MKVFMVVCFCINLLVFGFAFIVDTPPKRVIWFPLIVFGFIMLLGVYCVLGTAFWSIKLDGDDIEYCDIFGFKHHYKFSELDKVIVCLTKAKAYRTKVYKDGRKIFTIDDNVPGWAYFDKLARKRGVYVVIDKSLQDLRTSMAENNE